MIDISSEPPITFAQGAAAQACRRQGKRVSTVTMWRWATRGCDGVILESLQTPSGRVTSMAAIQRFFEALTKQRESGGRPEAPGPRRRSISRRQRDSARAERKLIKGGA
jgi:hypothetical protein